MLQSVSSSDAFNAFKPESCVFVLSIDRDGNPNGMVAGWNTKCSNEPPMFLVSISKNKNTHRLIHESGEFVIAVPNKEIEKDLVFFGTNHGHLVDKFGKTQIKTEKAKHIRTPLLADATINFECKLIREVDVGDHHTLFI